MLVSVEFIEIKKYTNISGSFGGSTLIVLVYRVYLKYMC
jgi:hypothetical protein